MMRYHPPLSHLPWLERIPDPCPGLPTSPRWTRQPSRSEPPDPPDGLTPAMAAVVLMVARLAGDKRLLRQAGFTAQSLMEFIDDAVLVLCGSLPLSIAHAAEATARVLGNMPDSLDARHRRDPGDDLGGGPGARMVRLDVAAREVQRSADAVRRVLLSGRSVAAGVTVGPLWDDARRYAVGIVDVERIEYGHQQGACFLVEGWDIHKAVWIVRHPIDRSWGSHGLGVMPMYALTSPMICHEIVCISDIQFVTESNHGTTGP